jgi:hypothetical protein
MQKSDMWAEVDLSQVYVERKFRVIGTGHAVPDRARYLGTAHVDAFVWHRYEVNDG